MASIQAKREWVANMYPGKNWKKKVRHMSDIQVTAIYLNNYGKSKPKKENKNDDEIPF